MKDLGHGANIEQVAQLYNINPKDIIDFSSNINPNMMHGLEKYIIEGLKNSTSYPDIEYKLLRKNISDYINIDPEYIIPGNGATEIIYLLMKSIGKNLAILNPTFSEYRRSAKVSGVKIIDLNLDDKNQFLIDIESIEENIERFDSLFICNPNNPTGKVQDLSKLLDLMKQYGKFLIVDETFMEFVDKEQEYTLIKYIQKYDNIFIIKAATKFFGMPGLRLGYGVTSNKKLIKNIYKYKEPWTINSFAENLSNYIFMDKKYIVDSKNYYINERKYMLQELRNINNIKVYDTDTNFILIKLINKRANEIKVELLRKGNILIRDASNFIGLDDRYIRIAIKSHRDNEIIIAHLKDILS